MCIHTDINIHTRYTLLLHSHTCLMQIRRAATFRTRTQSHVFLIPTWILFSYLLAHTQSHPLLSYVHVYIYIPLLSYVYVYMYIYTYMYDVQHTYTIVSPSHTYLSFSHTYLHPFLVPTCTYTISSPSHTCASLSHTYVDRIPF